MKVAYINSPQLLEGAASELRQSDVLGIDIECENNLHHYGTYISIIQVSSREKDYIFDILALKEADSLMHVFSDGKIEKIFHDTGFDLRIIFSEFGCRPKNIFDTQVAAKLLGKTELGLGPLLKHYFDVQKEDKFQRADWTRRPLTEDMLAYAAKDSSYLIRLRDILKGELEKKGRLAWAEEEFRCIEETNLEYHEGQFQGMKGIRDLTDRERSVLKQLYDVREKVAQQVNRPIYFIISNKMLMELSKNPPSLEGWKRMRGVHPAVRSYAGLFFSHAEQGKKGRIVMERVRGKRLSMEQKQGIDELTKIRDRLAHDLEIPPHILLSKEQMIEIVVSDSLDSLKAWQRKIIEDEMARSCL